MKSHTHIVIEANEDNLILNNTEGIEEKDVLEVWGADMRFRAVPVKKVYGNVIDMAAIISAIDNPEEERIKPGSFCGNITKASVIDEVQRYIHGKMNDEVRSIMTEHNTVEYALPKVW